MLKDHWKKILHWHAVVFFVDHVVSYDKVRVEIVGFFHVQNLLLAMRLTDDLQSTNDELHLEKRIVTLELLLDPFEYLHLGLNTNLTTFVINDHAKDVSEFKDEYVLLDENLADFNEASFEKFVVVD